MTKAGKPWPIPPETPTTLEALARGRQVFMQNCAECHGAGGQAAARKDLLDDKGVPISPVNFTHGVFKGTLLTTWRILRCQPFCEGGHEPVPEPGRWRSTRARKPPA